MKTLKYLLAISILSAATLTSNASIYTVTAPIVNPANGHSYYLLSTASWTDSEAFAQTLGGHLATINDLAENQWVFNTFPSLTGVAVPMLWIGYTDSAVEDTWVWASGESSSFTLWATGEPNNSPEPYDPDGEDYAVIRPPGYTTVGNWNDVSNIGGNAAADGTVFGVVEVVPEPGTLALAATGLGAMLALRRKKA